jgi:hypothetical protein
VPANRHGDDWEYEDYAALVDALRNGLDIAALAAHLDRSPGAVQAAINRLTPVGEGLRGAKAVAWLRTRLAEGDYPWLVAVWERTPGIGVWSAAEDAVLTAGWAVGTPLPVLASRLGVPEVTVLRRLIRLGLAAGVVEVVDWLGCSPGGAVEQRYRLAVAGSDATVFAAVVEVGGRLRVSVHSSRDAATAAIEEDLRLVDDDAEVGRWAVRRCAPGLWTTLTLRGEPQLSAGRGGRGRRDLVDGRAH